MRVLMMGSGGVGGYYGARLAQAGHDVTFVARGAHADAMRRGGLQIRSELGDATVQARVVEAPADAGVQDLVVIAVKLWDSETAARAVANAAVAETTVVSLQNGVDKDDVLTKALGGPARVIGGVTHIGAVIAEPGVIAHTGKLQRITIGELHGGSSPRITAIVSALQGAGIDAHASEEIRRVTWEKFVFLTALSGLTSLTRKPIGAVREHPATRAMLTEALKETAAVARAEGIALDAALAEQQLKNIDALPAAMLSSMSQDLLRGRRLELEWLSGAVVRRGEARGVPTPTHRAIHAALVLHANGAV